MRGSKLMLGEENVMTLFLVCRHSQSPWRAGGDWPVHLDHSNSHFSIREV